MFDAPVSQESRPAARHAPLYGDEVRPGRRQGAVDGGDPGASPPAGRSARPHRDPDDLRQRISERLTPGSSLIIADTGDQHGDPAEGRRLRGAVQYSSPKTAANSAADSGDDQPVKKKRRTVRRNNYNYSFGYNTQPRGYRAYPGWPW